jgi:hypothetical protein
MVLSMVGSAFALLVGHLNRKKSESDLRRIDRLIELADKALAAQASELKALEEELNGIIAWFVKGQASGAADSTAISVGTHTPGTPSRNNARRSGKGRQAPYLNKNHEPYCCKFAGGAI